MANTGTFNLSCSGKLNVELHRPGLLGIFKRAVSADCIEFSLSGMRLQTRAKLKVGESLVIDLAMHDVRVEELEGVVRKATADDNGRCYDIDFAPSGTQRGTTLHCLRHIDSHIRALAGH
jgi:PilZ domain